MEAVASKLRWINNCVMGWDMGVKITDQSGILTPWISIVNSTNWAIRWSTFLNLYPVRNSALGTKCNRMEEIMTWKRGLEPSPCESLVRCFQTSFWWSVASDCHNAFDIYFHDYPCLPRLVQRKITISRT